MMYNKKMVSVIKVDGKILREVGDVVYIPFGSEYEIMFSNLHTTRAVVNVSIDGEDVLGGKSLCIDKNATSTLEGFLDNSRVTHKFKFIEKTEQISEYRGDRIHDGIIRISYKFEKPTVFDIVYPTVYRSLDWGCGTYNNTTGTPYRGSTCDVTCSAASPMASYKSEDGITVKGSSSDQHFNTTVMGVMEEQEHSIVFHLKGQTTEGKKIENPVLVKTKVKCDTCGLKSLPTLKFCGRCGTSLVI